MHAWVGRELPKTDLQLLFQQLLTGLSESYLSFGTSLVLFCHVMKVALPKWGERVSPVFDVARCLLVVDVEDGAEIARQEHSVQEEGLVRRATRVSDLGVRVLICGAISMPLEQMLTSAGVQVIPHTCGLVEAVLQAFVSGTLAQQQRFLMPGCCGRRGYGRGGGGRHGRGWAGGNR